MCFDGALANRAKYEYALQHGEDPHTKHFLEAITVAQYHPVCGGTGPDDKWADTTQKAAAPAPLADPAVTKTLANLNSAITAANKTQDDPKAKTALQQAENAYQQALVNTKATTSSKTGTSPSSTKVPSAGVQQLKVIVPIRTGNPVWDVHFNRHYTVEIGTRSTFSMYNFLGRLLNNQDSPANDMIGPPLDENYNSHLLTVVKGQPVGCFVSALIDGVYCVPNNGAHNTKSTFSILAQLLALKTTTNDLQLLPTIRLLPTD